MAANFHFFTDTDLLVPSALHLVRRVRFPRQDFTEVVPKSMVCGLSGRARQFQFLVMSLSGSQILQTLTDQEWPEELVPILQCGEFCRDAPSQCWVNPPSTRTNPTARTGLQITAPTATRNP
jgi:hypothetical protein